MAPGDSAPGGPGKEDRPEYNVYRAGAKSRGRRGDRESARSGDGGDPSRREQPPGEGPGYTVYRSRRGLKRPGSLAGAGAGLKGLGDRFRRGEPGDRPPRAPGDPLEPGERPRWHRILRWAAIAAGCWVLLSAVLFVVSAQIQKGKLNDDAKALLGGSPFLLADGQTILVIGTDARPEGSNEAGAETDPECIDAAAAGDPAPSGCEPVRADTLMLVHAGAGKFNKVSIPRDTLASIPGHDPQKINAAYAFGGAALQIETVENFLGIDVNHVVILDFEGFGDFIDAIGGVTVNLPNRVKSYINGGSKNGGVTLKLDRGENHLDGTKALALARTRQNLRDPSEDDTDRAKRQQLILAGIKNQLTSPWRIPANFIRGPWIGWNAPKAMVSDMGGWILPQVALSAAIAGDSGTKILTPAGQTAAGELIVSTGQCRRAVKHLLGGQGEEPPACSPAEAPAPVVAEAPVAVDPTVVPETPIDPVVP